MFLEFIQIVDKIKELAFPDKLFLALSFRALGPEEQEVLLEQLKTDPSLLNKITESYSRKKEFLEKGDDVGYYKYQQEEERRLKTMIEQHLEEEKKKQIKNLISHI